MIKESLLFKCKKKSLTDIVSQAVLALQEMNGLKIQELDLLKSRYTFATKKDLIELGEKIMSKISDFADKQKAYNDRIDKAVAGLNADIESLNALIENLQNSPGEISVEDQASLDALDVRGQAIATKLEALDALTPPVVPV